MKTLAMALLTVGREDLPLAMAASTTSIFYVSLSPTLLKGYQIHVTEVEPNTAHLKSQNTLSSENEVASQESVVYVGSQSTAPIIVWADKSFKTLKVNILGRKDIATFSISKHGEDSVRSVSVHAPKVGQALTHFLVHYRSALAHWAEVYHIDPGKGSVSKAYDLPKLDGQGAFSVNVVDSNVYFTRHTDSEIILVSSVSHGILERWPVRPKSSVTSSISPVVAAVSEVVSKASSSFAIRSAWTLVSGDVELVLNGEYIWTRPESLSAARCAAWVDFPHERELESQLEHEIHENVGTAYVHRVSRHIQDLKEFPTWLLLLPSRILSGFGVGGLPNTRADEFDSFGFRKMIIVATGNGKVFALDSGLQGKVIWSTQAVTLGAHASWNVTDISLDSTGILKIVAPDLGRSIRLSLAGQVLADSAQSSDFDVANQEMLIQSQRGDVELAVSSKGIPLGTAAQSLSGSATVITQDHGGSLIGWRSKGSELSQVWEFNAPEKEMVSKVVARPSHDPVASIGRPLGDRNVLYKYLSPNLLLVTTSNIKASSASIYLLDSVSGQTLYNTKHIAVDTAKGIEATFSENWFAYTLHLDPALASNEQTSNTPKSTVLVISELYESPIANDRGPLGQADNVSSLSSTAYAPYVVSATYIVPSSLSHLTTTSTMQGITPRSILAYSSSLAALLAIPVSLLSPRRPVGRDPTPAEREEGLIRYAPLLDFPSQWSLSHEREVLGINGIVSTPSELESTSLVFAYGELDVFGTRSSPIGTFDMLGKGFGRLQLILTVVALGIGTGVLAPMVCPHAAGYPQQRLTSTGSKEADRQSLAYKLRYRHSLLQLG